MPFEQGEAIPFVRGDAPARAFYLANAGGGAPLNLVLLGPTISGFVELSCAASANAREFCRRALQMRYRASSVASVFVLLSWSDRSPH